MTTATNTIDRAFFEISMIMLDVEIIAMNAAIGTLDAGGHEHAHCRDCDCIHPVMDLNTKGICEDCEGA